MKKIGRNEPCPCGSGKKYKKCCMDQDESRVAADREVAGASGVAAKMYERSDGGARMQPWQQAHSSWPPSEVAALETDEIITRLGDLGIACSQQSFLELTEGRTSAWELSEVWRKKVRPRLSGRDDDFIGLAACELWKRYCPDNPSVEMLDDWMQAGYDHMVADRSTAACDRWTEVWQVIGSRLQPDMRDCRAARVVFDGTQLLGNWVQDFVTELYNAAVKEARYADTGIEFCEEILRQFPDEEELFRRNFRGDLGVLYFMAGKAEQGEKVLLELIRDYPDHATGYAFLSDRLGLGFAPSPQGKPIDLARAIRLLEEALARPVKDAADYDLQARLDDLLRKDRSEGK